MNNEILINKYGQGLVDVQEISSNFNLLDNFEKRNYLSDLVFFITQSKVNDSDIINAINESTLKSTFTPCVMLTKGIEKHNLKKIIDLPENELDRVLLLFLSLFRIGYKRRFEVEKNSPSKWWYWDLSKEENLLKLRSEERRVG